jgi:hypothetical protein
VHGELGFELADALTGRCELGALTGAQPGLDATVNAILKSRLGL